MKRTKWFLGCALQIAITPFAVDQALRSLESGSPLGFLAVPFALVMVVFCPLAFAGLLSTTPLKRE